MDNFELDELKGRNKLKLLLDGSGKIEKYEFTEGKFDLVDCYTTGSTGLSAFEIKNRNMASDKYANYILELTKYNALINCAKEGYTPYYINFFADDKVILWQVSKINIAGRVKQMFCNKTTAGGSKTKTLKYVVLLYPDEGKIINITQFNNK